MLCKWNTIISSIGTCICIDIKYIHAKQHSLTQKWISFCFSHTIFIFSFSYSFSIGTFIQFFIQFSFQFIRFVVVMTEILIHLALFVLHFCVQLTIFYCCTRIASQINILDLDVESSFCSIEWFDFHVVSEWFDVYFLVFLVLFPHWIIENHSQSKLSGFLVILA